ncbi:MAG: chloride channel protein [Planctomycetota bacterium]|nr:MAG: chloride channel protein [Planctomycetota bacterium]
MALFEQLGKLLDIKTTTKWILLAGAVGVVAGLGAIVFQIATQAVSHFVLGELGGYHPPEAAGEPSPFRREPESVVGAEGGAESLGPTEGGGEERVFGENFSWWRLVLVVGGGGLVSGVIVYTLAPEAEGHGTDAAIDAFHNNRGIIRPLVPLVKTVASAVTIGTGGSGGREGPIAQIGAGFGSNLATWLGLPARDRRIMLAAGMGAGIGAIFRAPLAGALFATEILYSDADVEADVLVPAATASVVSYSVYSQMLPAEVRYVPLFGSSIQHQFRSPLELIPYALLSLILVLVGVLYVRMFYGTHRLFKKLPVVPHVRPAIGGVATALVALGLFWLGGRNPHALAVLGSGYGTLQVVLTEASKLSIPLLVAVACGKIVTTSLTIGSGGSGGVFGPSMVIGGSTGVAVGLALHQWWPSVVQAPEAFGIVGMAGFFAGIARAPISTVIMVREMTGDYSLLVPTMLASTLCFVLCRRTKLYEKQVPTRLDSPAHRGDFIVDVLEGYHVRDVFEPGRPLVLIPESMPLEDIVHKLAETHQHYFPVVDKDGKMVGIFSADDVRAYLYDETIWRLAVARDIMTSNIVSVTLDDDLNTAMQRFTALNLDELPVVDKDDPGKLLGMLRRKETIAFYNQKLMELKRAAREANE